ncbi:MAG: chlorite dismutase family protein [Flavobacteriaceae bacterium]
MNTIYDFIGGNSGDWKVTDMITVKGEPIKEVSHIDIVPSTLEKSEEGIWVHKAIVSNTRYVEREELTKLQAVQPNLGRKDATCASLIFMDKSDKWWVMTQDERREIFEEKSHHIGLSMKYLPAIARAVYHSRDIKEEFDFVAWFEYAPSDTEAYENLLIEIRKVKEWDYVTREIDIRLVKVED